MKLEDKLEFLDNNEIDEETKNIYIKAGYKTINDIIKASWTELSNIVSKHKNRLFRNLQRCIHDNGLKFDYELKESFKQMIIEEDIDIAKLDLSTYMITTLEKYKIKDSKTLYRILKNEPYKIYKLCRNTIHWEFINRNWYLKEFFDLDNNVIEICEKKYLEEIKFYKDFLLEFNYIMLYLYNRDININKLNLLDSIKSILVDKNIYTLNDLLYDFRFNVIKDISLLDNSFNYKYYKVYDYIVIEDIIKYIKSIILVLCNDIKYKEFKNNIDKLYIKNFNINEELVLKLGLSVEDSVVDLLNKIIDLNEYKVLIDKIYSNNKIYILN